MLGLDPRLESMPQYLVQGMQKGDKSFQKASEAVLEFNTHIIRSCAPYVVAIKPQIAFYECLGWEGLRVLAKTIELGREQGLLVVIDAKRNDIGHTAQAYAEAFLCSGQEDTGILPAFDADALTVNPYLGFDGIQPFVHAAQKRGKGLFVLVRTSNPSAQEIQDLQTLDGPVYSVVGNLVHTWGKESLGQKGYSLVNAVVGATYPDEARTLRKIMPHAFFLVPGFGAQGGTTADVLECFHPDGLGAVINASRSILYAYTQELYKRQYSEHKYAQAAADAARIMRDEINEAVAQRYKLAWEQQDS